MTYDAGGCSESNARFARELGVHYVFALDDNQPTLLEEAQAQLGGRTLGEADDCELDKRGGEHIRRYVFRTEEMAGWLDWSHLKTVVRIHKVVEDEHGSFIRAEDRYYLTSLRSAALTARQWNLLVRKRWAVENQCHHTWDTIFEEDDRPWITADPTGAMVVAVLRRIAYNLMPLYRSVTLRSDENRTMPWKRLISWFTRATLTATKEDLGLPARRSRPAPAV